MATKLTGAKRQSYTVSEKSERKVRLWGKSKGNLEKMPRLKRANRGKTPAGPELEVDMLSWITEKRNNGLAILPLFVDFGSVA